MKVLVTGATGFIGKNLVRHLCNQGNIVHIIYRNDNKLDDLPTQNIEKFKGDFCDPNVLERAMKGCGQVYHLAALASVWSKNRDDFFDINFKGTVNLLETAIKHKVQKVLITSTAGVFGPSKNKQPVNEETQRFVDYFSEYERTKDYTDRYIMANYKDKIDFVIVYPTRVYGSGELSESNSVTKMIKMYLNGKWRFLPGNGKSVGNYVFIDDVVKGMELAMGKGYAGEKYILGGENLSFIHLFGEIKRISGRNYRLFKIPVIVMLWISKIMLVAANIFNTKPLITPGWARKYLYNYYISIDKAQKELAYNPTPFSEGLEKTIKWIKQQL